MTSWRRALRRAVLRAHLIGLPRVMSAVATIALVPATASAHGHLTHSEPSAGARLVAAPTQLRLTFSEAPELAVTTLRLLGPAGAAVPLGALAAAPDAPRAVVASIRGPLAPGTYTVVWQMAGADGHPTRGRFTFTVAPDPSAAAGASAGAPGAPLGVELSARPALGRGATGAAGPAAGEAGAGVTAPGQAPPPARHHPAAPSDGDAFDAASWPYVGIRWLQYVGLLVVLGAVAFRYAVLGFYHRVPHREESLLAPARERAARIGLGAALVLGFAAVFRLGAQSYAMHGAADALNGSLVGTMVAHTLWGWGWALQVAGVVVAAVAFRAAAAGRERGWVSAALGAAVLTVTPALAGHAASARAVPVLAVVADSLHVAAAGAWLGSLVLVLAAGLPAALALHADRRGPAVAVLVDSFSPTALLCAAAALMTGVFATWLHVGTVPALWGTAYGRTLLLKLGALTGVAATGLYNWRRVKPTLTGAPAAEGAARLRRSAIVELGVALLVLLVTAVLVATPTPMDAAGGS